MTTDLVIACREIEELTDFNAAQTVLLYDDGRRFLQTVLAQSLAYSLEMDCPVMSNGTSENFIWHHPFSLVVLFERAARATTFFHTTPPPA